MQENKAVLVIVGPTASGKTALSIELAKKFNGEVISADSRQVYRGLDIGTGKVTKREMGRVRHHLLDVCSPKKTFSADDYVRLARAAIDAIHKRGKTPIIVGGTGFYIDALTGRIPLPDVKPNPALRARLSKKTASQLFEILQKKDPRRARTMDTPSERNNKVRLIRALEIASSKSSRHTHQTQPPYTFHWIGINPHFDVLEAKISKRLTARFKLGMVAEAKKLHAAGLSYRRMKELGLEYRSLARFLQGEISRTEIETELNRDIRRYAKHQLTYWKRNIDIHWFDPNETTDIEKHVRSLRPVV